MPHGARDLAGAIVQPTALLVGAGFSYWAARLPTASRLFDLRITPRNTREEQRLRIVRKLTTEWKKTNGTVVAEELIEHVLDDQTRYRPTLLWYITRRLSDPFIASISRGTQALMIDDPRAHSLAGVRRARSFLDEVRAFPLSGILTPNYDLLLEYALSTRGFNYGEKGEILYGRGKYPGFPWRGAWPMLLGDIPIAKVHGSISWDTNLRYTDGRCGVKGNALIVPPRHGKKAPDELKNTWNLGASILAKSSKLLVFGFAFNPYDEALLTLLAKNASRVKEVLLIDVAPRIDEARSLWPAANITSCAPPPAGKRELRKWIEQFWYITNVD